MTSRIQSLYKTAVDMLPGNCRMHHNYATTLQNGKEREFHLREAVRLWPAYAAAWANLGVELAQTGRLSEACVNTRRLAAHSKTWSPFHPAALHEYGARQSWTRAHAHL